MRPADTVARLGGDEFVVVREDVDERAALGLAWRSAGAARPTRRRSSRTPTPPPYRARGAGRGNVGMFDERLRRSAVARVRTEAALEGALDRRELELVFQPIVRLADESVVGRDRSCAGAAPAAPRSSPRRVHPVAEESGLIVPIGSWVIEQACRAGVQHPAAGWTSVNLSTRQLADPGIAQAVTAALKGTGLAPALLHLEVTETALLQMTGSPLANVQELRSVGVRLVLDDFGTGYSSLRHLHQVPVDMVKIDRSFVANLGPGRPDAAIVGAVIHMSAALGLEVVAEGVERPAQAEQLRELGCPLAQGFHFGRPQPRRVCDGHCYG